MRKLRVLTILLFGTSLFFLTPDSSIAQCAPNPGDKEALTSNEFFEVISPNEIRFRPGIGFEITISPNGKKSLHYGRSIEGTTRFEEIEAGGLKCACDCPEADCEVTITESGDARCRGGCYSEGAACLSCHWHSEA